MTYTAYFEGGPRGGETGRIEGDPHTPIRVAVTSGISFVKFDNDPLAVPDIQIQQYIWQGRTKSFDSMTGGSLLYVMEWEDPSRAIQAKLTEANKRLAKIQDILDL